MEGVFFFFLTFIYSRGVSLRATSLFQELPDHMHTSTAKVLSAATEATGLGSRVLSGGIWVGQEVPFTFTGQVTPVGQGF